MTNPSVIAMAQPAVVGEEDHHRPLGQVQGVELVQDAAYVPVNVLTHGQSRSHVRNVFPLGIAMVHQQILALKLIPPAIRDLHRRMRRVVRDIDKKRLLPIPFHERHRLIRKVVDDKSLASDNSSIVFQHRAVVVTPVARAKTVVFFKPTRIRVIRVLHPVMPFTKGRRRITSRLKGLANRHFIQVDSFATGRCAENATARMIASRQKLGPCRRTNWTDEKTVKLSPRASQRINLRSSQVLVAVETQVTPPLIISQNNNNIRTLGRLNLRRDRSHEHQQNYNSPTRKTGKDSHD